jgi:hypothetical protein
MTKITLNAPAGVTAIQLDNGDEAIYLNGECLACATFANKDDPVIPVGERLAGVLGVPFRLLELNEPGDEEWSWNDVVANLGWGREITLGRNAVSSVLECSTAHLTRQDMDLLAEICAPKFEGAWIMDSDIGYLFRLNARIFPLLALKKTGLSRSARRVIACALRYGATMVHFSQIGDELEGFEVFDW